MNRRHSAEDNMPENISYKTMRRKRIANNLKRSPYAKALRMTIAMLAVVAGLQFLISLISLPLGQYMENYIVTNIAEELDKGE